MSKLTLNKSPLDQQCKLLLEKQGITPDPACPYSLQTLIWGLENLELSGPWAKFHTPLLEQARILLSGQPETVLKLMKNPDVKDAETGAVELESEDLVEVAGNLIENFLGNLERFSPGFR